MFTSSDVEETRQWVSRAAKKSVPVASIAALETWEDVFPRLPSFGDHNAYSFYEALSKEPFKQQVIKEVMALG